jgi:hypothetical protein
MDSAENTGRNLTSAKTDSEGDKEDDNLSVNSQ